MKDRSRLPRWAQNEIAVLERRVSQLTNEVDGLLGRSPSSVSYSVGISDSKYLPEHVTVTFELANGQAIRCFNRNGQLDINGDRPVHILPKAENAFEVI